ncbi:MAG: fibrobacter succinogenes major paralogous domain-containing protein, partial [Prevotella sp.]|nr:fibrobacter succinogenes major paralogous domain-containing protein [Prevotella sp.]
VSYTVYGNPAGAPVFVQFSDLVDTNSNESVTFETGRQYTLNLTFGAGGNDSDPFINIGAFVTFSPLNDEELDGPVVVPPDPDHDPAATNFWAASNIYFKPDVQGTGDVGSLTFAESGADKPTGKAGYQGVYFKWGSLVGISANTTGDTYDDDNTFLFIPDLATGKYHKYKVGNVTSTPGDIIVNAYLGEATSNTWVNIPCADDNNLTTGRTVDALSEIYDQEANYKGDICKYLSDNRLTNDSGLISEWRMPTSDKFAGAGYQPLPYTAPNNSVWKLHEDWSGSNSFVGGQIENGTSQTANAIVTYKYSPTGETVYFPASGTRNGSTFGSAGLLAGVGDGGGYWSSSAYTGTEAYYLFFGYGDVGPDSNAGRAYGFSVRCVRL